MMEKIKEWFESDDWMGSEIHFVYIAANILTPLRQKSVVARETQDRLFYLVDDMVRHVAMDETDRRHWDNRHETWDKMRAERKAWEEEYAAQEQMELETEELEQLEAEYGREAETNGEPI